MLRVMLVDDERPALDELTYLVGQYAYVEVVGGFTDSAEALKAIKIKEPDLVFLDIDMPVLNGLQIAEEILNLRLKTRVIFATAYDEYALEAFKKNAIDYLLKPYDQNQVLNALRKVKEQKEQQLNYAQLMEIQMQSRVDRTVKRLPIWKDDRIIFVQVDEITFCQVDGGEIKIHTDKEEYTLAGTLSSLEIKLPSQMFFKTHRAYIVNLSKIIEVSPYFNHTLLVKVEGSKEEIPVSRSNVKEFKEQLGIS